MCKSLRVCGFTLGDAFRDFLCKITKLKHCYLHDTCPLICKVNINTRIRDEFRMTLYAAKTLYETSLDFGIRQVNLVQADK